MDDHSAEVTRGLNQMDGYLYWQAEVIRARQAARTFAGEILWLSASEREDVEKLYTEHRLRTSRETVDHVADRCRQLQQAYEQRYRRLKWRLIALLTIATAAAAALSALVTLP